MIRPKDCSSVVASSLLLPPFRSTSPTLVARPSGVIAHITYVRYSGPNLVAGSSFCISALILITPCLLSTLASPRGLRHQAPFRGSRFSWIRCGDCN